MSQDENVQRKIRLLRQLKGWSQEEMAAKLNMSLNGYGSIERGDTDVSLSRLEQIAALLGVPLVDLFEVEGRNVFNLGGSNNDQRYWSVNSSCSRCPRLQAEVDKYEFMLKAKDQEILYLKEIIGLLKTRPDNADLQSPSAESN